MKKIYKRPEMSLIALGDDIMDGLVQQSVRADGGLPDGTGISDGGEGSASDDPDAKKGFWDDDYED